MGVFQDLLDNLFKKQESNWLPELGIDIAEADKQYLRKMSEDTVFNFIGRTMSTLQIKFSGDKTKKIDRWKYKLNVRPNHNQSASDFWHKFFTTLIRENEVLVILQNDQMMIADSFFKDDTTDIYNQVFQSVDINGYTFNNRNFKYNEVIYIKNNDEDIRNFTVQLFKDYSKLFDRVYSSALRNNQIRAAVKINKTGSLSSQKGTDGKTQDERLDDYMKKMFKKFEDDPVAIATLPNGMDYEEFTNKIGSTNQSLNELNELKKSNIDDLANVEGIPTALIYGEKSELDSNLKAYRKLCINPLVKKLQDELTFQIISKDDYASGVRLKVINVLPENPFELSTQIDKLISSGVFTPNFVREELGYEPSLDPAMDKHYITKNYETTEGGETAHAESK